MDARQVHGDGRKARLAAWAAAVLLSTLPGGAGAAQRVALVIGNGAYEKVPYLANPRNDAADVGAALGRLGFEVSRLANADQAVLREGLRNFTRAAVGRGGWRWCSTPGTASRWTVATSWYRWTRSFTATRTWSSRRCRWSW